MRSDGRLEAFLYLLVRDVASERRVEDLVRCASTSPNVLTNPKRATRAREWAGRLR